MSWIFSLTGLPLVVLMGVSFYLGTINMIGYRMTSEAMEWPTVDGRVAETTVDVATVGEDESEGPGDFEAYVRYVYRVDGEEYHGSTVVFGGLRAGTPEEAEELLEPYPVGASVQVHHDPEEPRFSVLHPEVNPEPRRKAMRWFGLFGVTLAVFGYVHARPRSG